MLSLLLTHNWLHYWFRLHWGVLVGVLVLSVIAFAFTVSLSLPLCCLFDVRCDLIIITLLSFSYWPINIRPLFFPANRRRNERRNEEGNWQKVARWWISIQQGQIQTLSTLLLSFFLPLLYSFFLPLSLSLIWCRKQIEKLIIYCAGQARVRQHNATVDFFLVAEQVSSSLYSIGYYNTGGTLLAHWKTI